VDAVLADYLGPEGAQRRSEVQVRADRCGVFSASATVSDKNQGIPLAHALAVTIKSEVLKACKKLVPGFKGVWLTGGVFCWRFARECAIDYLLASGVAWIEHDRDNSFPLEGLRRLAAMIGPGGFSQPQPELLRRRNRAQAYPAFQDLKAEYEASHLYSRMPDPSRVSQTPKAMVDAPLLLGIDVGSTMAKLVVADGDGGDILYSSAYTNAGDTIETVKAIFRDLQKHGSATLRIRQIGLTGSARYQVQKALLNIYPQLAERLLVLVENYAHARGSIDFARRHIAHLKSQGVEGINEEFCVLVDIGGEDTKISSIALERSELFDNAMNIKCSAGTGSLMDTLAALFSVADAATASDRAMQAAQGYAINATCAVFLMENARRLQAEDCPEDEIFASAAWAIVENMARTLWSQIELPPRTVTLLHGQTMLSDPLPLAVTHRLQAHLGDACYCLVPPQPGHRACFGLIQTLADTPVAGTATLVLGDFIHKTFEKRIIQCAGAACGDPEARCSRSHLSGRDGADRKFSLSLGGCSAINELLGNKQGGGKAGEDSYKKIWEFQDRQLPRSDQPHRLVIPRSFALSEWAGFFAHLFASLGIPVHVDNVQEQDIVAAQPHFHIDTCAPHIGAVGQFQRLAAGPHGVILAPQIEFLPAGGRSLGRTCTINQGGMAVARNLALVKHPEARIHLFNVNLQQGGAVLAESLLQQLRPVLQRYEVSLDDQRFRTALDQAFAHHHEARRRSVEFAADLLAQALDNEGAVALVIGREYILNPGIYDSHVGRLLRDKGVVAIPGYLLDVELEPAFSHLYWRNPHQIATLADAAARGRIHQVVKHPRLRELFRRLESDPGRELLLIQVSTFLCGPDSVTAPLVMELTRNRPYLLIQSDAVIKELAHLENRVNTYVKQLDQGLFRELKEGFPAGFEVRSLEQLVHRERLDPATDVIALPTLADNRSVTAVIRAAGFSCLENYSDEGYDLQDLIRIGREFAGDSVCAPLAAVYGDVLNAVAEFKRRREQGDPEMAQKKRLLIVNNKGLGPCRQGQYVENHKLFLSRAGNPGGDSTEQMVMRFLVAPENKGFDFGLEDWALLRSIQGAILQGVLHQLLLDGGSRCRDVAEYERFQSEFRSLKRELYSIQEQRLKPGPFGSDMVRRFGDLPLLGWGVRYFGYRLYARDLLPPLQRFAEKWLSPRRGAERPVRLYVEGEVYMRVAQLEEIFATLLATLGFNKFQLGHSPVWCFLDYKLAGMMMRTREGISLAAKQLVNFRALRPKKTYLSLLRGRLKRLFALRIMHLLLRRILAAPLYRAAGLPLPVAMPEVLDRAKQVIPTRRPGGELVPYIGEAMEKLQEGYDLVLNVAPEGCMVSCMGEVMTPSILRAAGGTTGRIQHLFSQQGDVDEELISLALLKTLGPEKFYRGAGRPG
jgi:activator of 2-hydroxyglutaryl-CoA dehydratase/predicted nucleotide-binding protein (sugar kinase/HSP70/actin superfamily)